MLINGTLLVQIFHFLIAYVLLRYLFFKPVYGIIEKEDNAQKKQQDLLQDQKTRIAQQITLKREAWQECQHYFKHHAPSLVNQEPIDHKVPGIIVSAVPQEQVQKIRKELKELIISKVEHVS